ncbi:MAG TPA: beta-propeller fold lactonase family protein [Edaphobacter sp.]|nr:beta-propeller fold lactonase family protein [Edaphobacter sp.]
MTISNPSPAPRGLIAIAFTAASIALSGCAGFFVAPTTTTTTSTSNLVYVANATTETISGFAVGTNTLTAVSGSPLSLGYVPQAAVISRANTFLYVAGAAGIYLYTIASDGALTAGGTAASYDVASLDVSPDGNWLVGLNAASTVLDIWQINTSTGALTLTDTDTYTATGTVVPKMVRFAPSGSYIFAALGTGGDAVFTFNTSTGVAASSQRLSLGSTTTSDNALAVDSTSSTLYIARSGTNQGLAVYTIGSAGALTAVSGSPFTAGTAPYSVAIDSTGAYVYVANRSSSSISGFTIGTGSILTALSSSPFTSGSLVTSLATDNSGSYLLAAANGGSPDLTMYSFDSTTAGKLDTVAAVTTGTDPTGAILVVATH